MGSARVCAVVSATTQLFVDECCGVGQSRFVQARFLNEPGEQAMFDFPGTGVDKDIVAWYGVSALFGTVFMWVRSNFPYAPEELARAITKLNAQSP